MAIVYTEYELDDKTLQKYDDLGYEVIKISWFKPHGSREKIYYYKKPVDGISLGESVAFLLDGLYPATQKLIEKYLWLNTKMNTKTYTYRMLKDGEEFKEEEYKIIIRTLKTNKEKHKITLKYKNKVYKLDTPEDWKYSYQSTKDVNRITSYKHPVLQDFESVAQDRAFNFKSQVLKDKCEFVLQDVYNNKLPDMQEVNSVLYNYARLYGIRIHENSSLLDKLNAYNNIKFYLDNDLEPDYIPNEESIGNMDMLADFIEKFGNINSELTDLINNYDTDLDDEYLNAMQEIYE